MLLPFYVLGFWPGGTWDLPHQGIEPVSHTLARDTWDVKESTASEEDEPAWGCREERAISMEVSTAAADLTGGADAVVLRHPASVATIKKFITELV